MAEKLFEQLNEMNEGITEIKPQKWEALPDIDLYMDQVLKYMTRQGVEINPEDSLTASMVSNYVKSGTMPGANGKRYGREHLAYLTAIQTFKQVLPVKDTKELIDINVADGDTEAFYSKFLELLTGSLETIDFSSAADKLCEDGDINISQLGDLALKCAIASYTNKLACERLLYLARNSGKLTKAEKAEARAEAKEAKAEAKAAKKAAKSKTEVKPEEQGQ